MTAKQVDMDGDNDADDLMAYRLGNDWRLRVELTSGGGADAVVPGIDPAVSHLKALGGFDIGGGPTQEAFAIVGAGASTALIGIWTLDGCSLQRVTLNGDPSEFPVGATVSNLSALMCLESGALNVSGAVRNGSNFVSFGTDYDLVGTTLVGRPPRQPFTFADTDEANIEFSSWFECGGMTLD